MKDWLRKFPHPTYGKAGGARKDVAIRREELDPLDKLFYDHDWALDAAKNDEDRKKADIKLHDALVEFDDYKKIKWYRRSWARAYVFFIVKTKMFK